MLRDGVDVAGFLRHGHHLRVVDSTPCLEGRLCCLPSHRVCLPAFLPPGPVLSDRVYWTLRRRNTEEQR